MPDPTQSKTLLERAVWQGRAQGDPAVLTPMRQLAGLLAQDGDLPAARRLLEEADAAGQRFGSSDPVAVLLAHDLAVVARAMGDHAAARAAYGRVAASGPAVLGAGDPAVVQAKAYLDAGGPATPPADLPWPEGGVPRLWPAPDTAHPPAAAPAPTPAHAPAAAPVPEAAHPLAATPQTDPAHPLAATPQTDPAHLPAAVPVPDAARPSVAGPTPTAATHLRRSRPAVGWLLGGIAALVAGVVVVAVVLARPHDPPAPARADAPAPASTSSRTQPPAAAASAPVTPGAPGAPGASVAPSTRPPSASPSPRPATRTRIVAPTEGSSVPWPFTARFTVSPSDARATSTVLALSICVAGRCYLDGKLGITGGTAAPYVVRLGATKPEGVGVPWTLRLDRLTRTTYAALVSERDAEIANSTWGDKGTTMSALNPAPVTTLTVTKTA